ncbi:MAG: sel1 repeat family protein, partial [Alphaproteobacteria bacterium]|nr:sel1 repeat family protein [Alphaproteobacteria bacterium]
MNPLTSSPATKTPTWRRAAGAALLLAGIAAPSTAFAGFAEGFVHYVERNYRAAQNEVVMDAAKGDAQAQWLLGTMYVFGKGVQRNGQSARAWFEKSAAAN